MNKLRLFLSLVIVFITAQLTAQELPQAINFQAIARNSNGSVMANAGIKLQLTVIEGYPEGPAVYREIRSLHTNSYGGFNFQIGREPDIAEGSFADIGWANGKPKFLKVDYGTTGNTSVSHFSFNLTLGTIEFVSVPYAFVAENVPYIDATGAHDGDVLVYNAATGRFEPKSQDTLEETDPTVPDWAKEEQKPTYDYSEILNTPEIPVVPENVSAFTNDAGYLTNETDPTVPAWAKESEKPVYDYSEIQNTPEIPVVPENVSAFTNDAGYLTTETDPTVPAWAKESEKPVYDYSEIQNTPEIPAVPENVSAFNNDAGYLTTETDPTVPAWAKESEKPTYDYSEILNTPDIPVIPENVSAFTNDAGYITSADIPAIPEVPENVSAFNNDAGYLTNETDPTVPAWAKESEKPTYDYSEIQNTPEIPAVPENVSAFTNDANYITSADIPAIPEVPTNVSAFTNDAGYITSADIPAIPEVPENLSAFTNDAGYLTTEADPTVPAWAKESEKPVYDYSEIQNTPEIPAVPENVSAFNNDAGYLTNETDPTVPAWAKESEKPVYDYSEIQNTPEIPAVPENVSAFNNDAGYLTNETDPTVPAWAKESEKPVYDYSEIQNTPEIPVVPENVSAFTNDANYITAADIPAIPEVPENVSAFNNDAGYITSAEIPATVSSFINDANYIDNEIDPTVPAWAKESEKPVYDYSEIQNTPEIPIVPENVSAFNNDAGYLTELQALSISGDTVFLTGGSYVVLPEEKQSIADVAAKGNEVNTQLKNVTDPTEAQDAVTLAYLDAKIAELNAKIEQLQELMNVPTDSIATIEAISNPTEGGTIAGTGTYNQGRTCTLTAIPADNYIFSNWTENGEIVSTESTYTFTVGGNRDLVANFSLISMATVETANVSNISYTTATCGGNVTADGGASVTARGICYGTSLNPTISDSHTTSGTGAGSFTSNLTGLTANTTYYVRAYATNSKGTAYGEQKTFTTNDYTKPTVTTSNVSSITNTTATCGGNVTDDGGLTVTARGVCWSTSQNPTVSGSHTTNGTGTGSFTSSITGLAVGTTYYVRAYATNSKGTSYGTQKTFTTTQPTGAINGKFSVSSTKKVYFSQGNLQYQASTGKWRFAEMQMNYIGGNNTNISNSYSGWIDLFGWGTGNYPTNKSTSNSSYSSFTDWGTKPISNGGNQANQWRTLTSDECSYLLFSRTTTSGIRYAKATVNDIPGLVILPDDWSSSYYSLSSTNTNNAAYTTNTITYANWTSKLEAHGAVFLPAAGSRNGTTVSDVSSFGCYWSSSPKGTDGAYNGIHFYGSGVSNTSYSDRYYGKSVRLVRDAN